MTVRGKLHDSEWEDQRMQHVAHMHRRPCNTRRTHAAMPQPVSSIREIVTTFLALHVQQDGIHKPLTLQGNVNSEPV